MQPGEAPRWDSFDRSVLVLQGGGALGAYQAGAFCGLHRHGMDPDWVAGVSIGAINAALIAGNAPERRVERITAFWNRVSATSPPPLPAGFEMMRPFMNGLSTASAMTFGVPGFFTPRTVPPMMAADGSMGALSFYDTSPLKKTLEELVDFDLVNSKKVRLSLGAVNLRNGNSVYFDNFKVPLRAEHVMASGALPPGFPPVEIDGEMYWDGGIVSNSPLTYIADEGNPHKSAVVFQVDVFSGAGFLPQNLAQAAERAKDIQYSSKTRFNTDKIRQLEVVRASLNRVLDRLPKGMENDPDVKALRTIGTRGKVSLVHIINRHPFQTSQYKDCEFSRATVSDLWQAGMSDVDQIMTNPSAVRTTVISDQLSISDLTQAPRSATEKVRR